MLLAGQMKGLGPGGGAAACIRWPLPVGVTVKHTNRTWRGSLTTAGGEEEESLTGRKQKKENKNIKQLFKATQNKVKYENFPQGENHQQLGIFSSKVNLLNISHETLSENRVIVSLRTIKICQTTDSCCYKLTTNLTHTENTYVWLNVTVCEGRLGDTATL